MFKEYALIYIGILIMVYSIFLKGYWALWVEVLSLNPKP